MTGWSDAATRDWCEALACQQPDGQRSHAVTRKGTHSGIFMKGKAMSERERWAYEELQVGDAIQAGDQWQNSDGRWQAIVLTPEASMEVGEVLRVRRPHNITMMLAAFASSAEVLADAQQAATQLQDERDNALTTLKSAQRARDELQRQVDELRADRERLQGLIDNLLDEPTAKRVYKMLEDMLDQTEWVGQCLDSTTYEQMSCIQRTISVIAERVRDMGKEGTSADT